MQLGQAEQLFIEVLATRRGCVTFADFACRSWTFLG
jgi:hypothetical protein